MNTWKKITAVTLAVSVISASSFAQTNEKAKDKKEKTKEIIIRKNGENTEKMTIVVDGDKVTINGKPLDEYKGENVTVMTRDGSTRVFAPGARAFAVPGAGSGTRSWSSANSNKAFLGVVTEKTDNGVKVTQVTDESAAEKAGLKEDDVITKVGDKKIEAPADLVSALADKKPSDKIDITYKRNGKETKTSATLTENKSKSFAFNFDENDFKFDMPDIPGAPFAQGFTMNRKPKVGMQIQDVEEGKGVQVKDVDDDTPASKAGLKEGDVITQVNGKPVDGVIELRDAIKDVKEGESFTVTYRRGTSNATAEIKLPKRLRTANL
jgi:serine protease Do